MRRLYAEPCLSSSVGSKISQNRSGNAWPLQIGCCSATRSGFSSNASRSITTKSTSSSVSRHRRHRYRPVPGKVEVCKIVGGVTSPTLANVYLHYVFDLWAARWRRGNYVLDVANTTSCNLVLLKLGDPAYI